MSTYWLMLLVPLLAGLSPWKAKGALPYVQWFLYGCILMLIIGLRHEVGGDWFNYIENFLGLADQSFTEVFTKGSVSRDIGFEFTYWFALHFLNGIYAANLICAAIFIVGLLMVCKNMPLPWLALSISIPYLVIVVAMGYTRQAAAIGFIMMGLVNLIVTGDQKRFYIFVLLATLFHKTALIMLPVGYLYCNSIYNVKNFIIFLTFFMLAFLSFLASKFEDMMFNYGTNSKMESSGAFVRVLMNVGASVVFIIFRKEWAKRYSDTSLWMIFSVVSIIMLPLTIVSSTTVDRLALYFIPMQMIVLSRVPGLILNTYNRTIFILSVVLIYIGVLFVWLNYGTHASAWLPYRNILFQ